MNNFKVIGIFTLLIFNAYCLFAQLDSKHYLPPLKQTAGTTNNATRLNNTNTPAIKEQAIYLSTPETTVFTVNVYRGTNPTPWKVITNLSNTNPHIINSNGDTDTDLFTTGGLLNGNNNITLVNNGNTGKVLTNSGLRFESVNGEKFYVNYRGRSNSQAGSLTSKGEKALGRDFRWGGIPNRANNGNLSTSLGIMALFDNTRVNIFGYDPGCEFRREGDPDGITDNSLEIFLDAGETFVLEAQKTETTANIDGWLGATITSTQNIAISNGGLNVGLDSRSGSRDVGIDQPVPTNVLGREYVFVRGNGTNVTEFPIIVATQDGTQVFVNGSLLGTINNGEYLEIPGTNYSGTVAGSNMYVTTSRDAYAYQSLAGASGIQTGGMNFIAPVNCLLPDSFSEVPKIHRIAGANSNISALTIISSTITNDADIKVFENGVQIPQANVVSIPVAGTTEWKTVFVTKGNGTAPNDNLTGEISIITPGPIAVGTFMSLGANAGLAGYFSGFDTVPQVNIDVTGGGCFPGSNLREETGDFQLYEWFKDNVSISAPSPTLQEFDPSTTGTGDYFVRVTKGNCSYNSAIVTLYTCEPDISVVKEDDVDPILEGNNVTFKIKVESFGVDPVNNLIITDVLPEEFDFVSATPSSGAGSWTSPNWNIGTINPSQIFSLDIVVKVKDESGGQTITNTITYTSDSTEPTPNITPDDLTEPVTILKGEIALSKTGILNQGTNGLNVGDPINYTFTVTNPGEVPLENIVVNDPFLGGNITGPSSGDINNNNILDTTETWIYTANYTTLRANFEEGKVENTATVSSKQSNGLDKTDTDTHSQLIPAVDLSLIKKVNSPIVKAGAEVVFTVTIKNDGPTTATGIEVKDIIQSPFVYVSHTAPGNSSYNKDTGLWTLGSESIDKNDSLTLTIIAKINSAGNFSNSTEITKVDQFELDSEPNNGN